MIHRPVLFSTVLFSLLSLVASAFGQAPNDADAAKIKDKLAELQKRVEALKKGEVSPAQLADVEICAKAADWILRHSEFYKPAYVQQTLAVLDKGLARAADVESKKVAWGTQPGRSVLAYRSAVDESVQPYAISLPAGFDSKSTDRRPLHINLHGRNATMTEASFFAEHDGKPAPADQTWIQLDVFGRTNNAYRWAGEADVFEALNDVKRRYRIDEKRIVLRGFSMGGAGAWHLGLHYPSLWCSVGPGAGFVDFHKHVNFKGELPAYQADALHIYNADDYALNLANVPTVGYGGENDPQLRAAQVMVDAAKQLGVPLKLLIGPGVEHKWHPDSLKEAMAFHAEHQARGRPTYPGLKDIRFVTHTLKYNSCEWLMGIEETIEPYRPSVVEGGKDDVTGKLKIKTKNVAVLQIARDVADDIEIDGVVLPLGDAADGRLPGVFYEGGDGSWRVMSYDSSLSFPKNIDGRKRHNLQGPIDDAFMQPFVCVSGSGKPWSDSHAAWANWTLERLQQEFDKWMRGHVLVVEDTDVTPELMQSKNLILFGDPGSNSVLAKVLSRLPVQWTKDKLTVNGIDYDPASHGVPLINPNPLNPRRYIVINSGHTFHAEDFKNSNAWLFPRLGDIAVLKFAPQDRSFKEETVWAGFLDNNWQFPRAKR